MSGTARLRSLIGRRRERGGASKTISSQRLRDWLHVRADAYAACVSAQRPPATHGNKQGGKEETFWGGSQQRMCGSSETGQIFESQPYARPSLRHMAAGVVIRLPCTRSAWGRGGADPHEAQERYVITGRARPLSPTCSHRFHGRGWTEAWDDIQRYRDVSHGSRGTSPLRAATLTTPRAATPHDTRALMRLSLTWPSRRPRCPRPHQAGPTSPSPASQHPQSAPRCACGRAPSPPAAAQRSPPGRRA